MQINCIVEISEHGFKINPSQSGERVPEAVSRRKEGMNLKKERPTFEQFGVTEKECEAIYAKKDLIRNYTFGISSAVGILAGCIFGIYLSKGGYETVLFILFFGCFLGSLFGAIFTIVTAKVLYTLFLYIFSPAYRRCRQYLAAKSRAE